MLGHKKSVWLYSLWATLRPCSRLCMLFGLVELDTSRPSASENAISPSLLPWYPQRFNSERPVGHNKQLYGHWLEIKEHRALFGRSIFSMIDIYNNLPQSVVDAPSVSSFQNRLTEIARTRCKDLNPMWQLSFCRRSGPDLDGSVLRNSSIM